MNRFGHHVVSSPRDVRDFIRPRSISSEERGFSQVIHMVHSICYSQPVVPELYFALYHSAVGESCSARTAIVETWIPSIDEVNRHDVYHRCA